MVSTQVPISSQRLSVKEALAVLRLGKTRFHEKVRAGEIQVIRDGRRIYVPGREIMRLTAPPGQVDREAMQ